MTGKDLIFYSGSGEHTRPRVFWSAPSPTLLKFRRGRQNRPARARALPNKEFLLLSQHPFLSISL